MFPSHDLGRTFDVSTQATAPVSMRFTQQGEYLYVLDSTTDTIYEYVLTVPYGFGNTITYTDLYFDVSSQDATPQSFGFDDDITKFYMLGSTNDTLYEYDLGTAEVVVDLYTLGEGEKAKSTGVTFIV